MSWLALAGYLKVTCVRGQARWLVGSNLVHISQFFVFCSVTVTKVQCEWLTWRYVRWRPIQWADVWHSRDKVQDTPCKRIVKVLIAQSFKDFWSQGLPKESRKQLLPHFEPLKLPLVPSLVKETLCCCGTHGFGGFSWLSLPDRALLNFQATKKRVLHLREVKRATSLWKGQDSN